MNFKDHFSDHAALYHRYRPDYPAALYRYLADKVPHHAHAWDCATGNGQAAIGLAEYFDKVVATDASAAQLSQTIAHPRINYLVTPAEQAPFADLSVDLITVAQALHWFELDAFYREVRRVLKPGGILAVWSYNLLQCAPPIDAILNHFYAETVGPWWPPERTYIENGYRDLPFPFPEEISPASRWRHSGFSRNLSVTCAPGRRYSASRRNRTPIRSRSSKPNSRPGGAIPVRRVRSAGRYRCALVTGDELRPLSIGCQPADARMI